MTFESRHHPGDQSRGMLALRAQAQPVALALLVVMVVTLAAALEGYPVLWPFASASVLAYTGAAAYAQSRLHATPAELVVSSPFATLRSVWDVAGWDDTRPALVSSAKLARGELSVGLGDDVVSLRADDWPDFDGLVATLRGAAAEAQHAVTL